ncbi:MAG: NeuD/PglB/VioB family sugar acetyltransferase [Bacteroidia bacterium]|nr:NeuD/PglB/VioB family sugar acetyltransferase [Bacteroidia bacterium]
MEENADNRIPLVIVGAGTEGRLALDIALSADILVYGFLTDNEELIQTEVGDIVVIAALDSKDASTLLADDQVKVALAEGDPDRRRTLSLQLDEYNADVINLIHSLQAISTYARLGRGNLLGPGIVLQAGTYLGNFNLVGSHVSIGQDCLIGNYCTIQDGAHIGRGVEIEDEALIGMGAVIYPGVKIGEGAMVGAGAVVFQDVPDGVTVAGNPAQPVKPGKRRHSED